MLIRSNKEIVLEMYRRMIGGRDLSLLDNYISDNYVQHSATLRDGKAGLREALEQLKHLPPSKDKASPVICAIAEGEFVALLLDIQLMGKSLLVIDLFRLKEGLIVEHWDAMQENALAGLETGLNGVRVHRVLREDNWTMLQSGVTLEGVPQVCYDLFCSEGADVQQHIRVIQTIPQVLPHGNGMI